MPKNHLFTIILGLTAMLFSGCSNAHQSTTNRPLSDMKGNSSMEITSNEFINEGTIPAKYSCDGGNINPPLKISGVPDNTQSLALIVEDPDVPNGTWNHWIMWNIDPDTTEIGENTVPDGAVLGKNSSGDDKYEGPCPPSGTHRYYFKLFALDNKPELQKGSTKEDLLKAMDGHIITQVQLMGKFGPR